MPRSETGFEIVEHTADVGIRGWAPRLDSLFRIMARGLFHVIAESPRIQAVRERSVHLEAEDDPTLLHDWLEELNTLHQVHGELYSEFDLVLEPGTLTGVIRGEPLDAARHDLSLEVKAVTWHDLELRQTAEGYEAFVLLDI